MRGGLRVGSWLRSGPSGAPPPHARAWEVGNASPVGVLVRYPGAIYYDRVGAAGWMCTGSTATDWVAVGAIGALAEADFNVANDFDPITSGLLAPVGSRARTLDGAKAWLKYGAGAYDWRLLNETRASTTAAGGPLVALDLPGGSVVVPERMSVDLYVQGTMTGGDWMKLRADGAPVIGYGGGAIFNSINGVSFPVGYDGGGTGIYRVTIGASVGGKRRVEARGGTTLLSGYPNYVFAYGYLALGAVTSSLGIATHSGAARIANGFVLRARVYEDLLP